MDPYFCFQRCLILPMHSNYTNKKLSHVPLTYFICCNLPPIFTLSYSDCENLCNERICCKIEEEYSCFQNHDYYDGYCESFEFSCFEFLVKVTFTGKEREVENIEKKQGTSERKDNTMDEDSISGEMDSSFLASVDDLCSIENLTQPNGDIECSTACAVASCCWELEVEHNCEMDFPKMCDHHKFCPEYKQYKESLL